MSEFNHISTSEKQWKTSVGDDSVNTDERWERVQFLAH